MHGATVFLLRGGVTVKLRAFLGPGQPFSGAGRASLVSDVAENKV